MFYVYFSGNKTFDLDGNINNQAYLEDCGALAEVCALQSATLAPREGCSAVAAVSLQRCVVQ